MSIQRIRFEDRGQGFLWWEVDLETGRIVGCGPHQAATWAGGKCSVDVATLKVGQRPTFFGPATEPDGRRLNYAIAGMEPAGSGGGMASLHDGRALGCASHF